MKVSGKRTKNVTVEIDPNQIIEELLNSNEKIDIKNLIYVLRERIIDQVCNVEVHPEDIKDGISRHATIDRVNKKIVYVVNYKGPDWSTLQNVRSMTEDEIELFDLLDSLFEKVVACKMNN